MVLLEQAKQQQSRELTILSNSRKMKLQEKFQQEIQQKPQQAKQKLILLPPSLSLFSSLKPGNSENSPSSSLNNSEDSIPKLGRISSALLHNPTISNQILNNPILNSTKVKDIQEKMRKEGFIPKEMISTLNEVEQMRKSRYKTMFEDNQEYQQLRESLESKNSMILFFFHWINFNFIVSSFRMLFPSLSLPLFPPLSVLLCISAPLFQLQVTLIICLSFPSPLRALVCFSPHT